MSLQNSLKEILEASISDPLEWNRRIVQALSLMAKKLDESLDLTEEDHEEVLNTASNYE